MAKHLTKSDIDKILGVIDGWSGRLTWEQLCDAAKPVIGHRPTRQTLNGHGQIKEAFSQKKNRLRQQVAEIKSPGSLSIAGARIKRLEEENARLINENKRLLEQFVTWQYNAYKHGLSEYQLNEQLPHIDR